MPPLHRWALGLACAALTCSALQAAESLLKNGELAPDPKTGAPGRWEIPRTDQKVSLDATEVPPGAERSLRVGIQAAATNYGQVWQRLTLKQNAAYVLEGRLKSTARRLAFLQIKLYKDGKELKRISSANSDTEWKTVHQEFATGDADAVDILCRWRQTEAMVGQTAWFAQLKLTPAGPPRLVAAEAAGTFHSLGLAVRYLGGLTASHVCRVRYRKTDAEWRRGMDLVRCEDDHELRGSLLGLRPDTAYEVECQLFHAQARAGKALSSVRAAARTWKEDVPIGEVRRLPAGVSAEPLIIRDRGKPDAWILYAAPKGKGSQIDAGWKADHAVLFDAAAYVILENVTVRGGRKDCINVLRSHHIRIRRCDIAGWGDPGTKKEGLPKGLYVDKRGRPINMQAGIRVFRDSHHVVVEDNFIHDPRGTANSWQFGHPMGPQGIILGLAWNNVVRNNEIVGSEAHWWNDAIESHGNGLVNGGPCRDTDIYGNVLAFGNDDGTELDGGQINVRYWHNWITSTLVGISFAPNLKGPSYAFRNVIDCLGDERHKTAAALKMGYGRPHRGLSVILHNTRIGPGGGPVDGDTGDDGARGYRCFLRNNLVARHGEYLDAKAGSVPPGPTRRLAFVAPAEGDYRLAPASAGIDAGALIRGFNDEFAGAGPDVGAYERTDVPSHAIPYRRGMIAQPRRITLRAIAGKGVSKGTPVALTLPKSVGSRWTALPNSRWVRCRPATGPTGEHAQTVTISCDARQMGTDVGLRRAAVVFRTDRGLNLTLMVDAEIEPNPELMTVIEAEVGTLSGGMRRGADPRASGGAFVHAPEASGQVVLTFDVQADGLYCVLGRCLSPPPPGQHDSFFFSMDGAEPGIWDVTAHGGGWSWDAVSRRDRTKLGRSVDPVVFRLSRGRHRLTLRSRDRDCRLDRITIFNAPHAP